MRFRLLLIATILAVAAFGIFHRSHPPRTAVPTTAAPPVFSPRPAPALAPPAEPPAAGSALAADLNAPGGNAQGDVQALHALLRQYLRQLHHQPGLPIGDDIDLARVLTGHNPMRRVLIPPGHPALSADGHLRDRWGTPYFIHPEGYGAFEIRSAGPDRKLFTADDISDGSGADQARQQTEIPEGFSGQ